MPIATGEQALASDINAEFDKRKIVRKTADETVNNSNTLQNDDHLLIAIGANEVWLVELFLLQQSVSVNSDFKMGWSYPTGCSIKWGSDQVNIGGARVHPWLSVESSNIPEAIKIETDSLSVGTSNLIQGIRVTAIVINGATAGNLNLQWAQNTATAEDTKVLTNSCLIAFKLA